MTLLSIDAECLLGRLRDLGKIGRAGDGRLVRLTGSDADKARRDAFVAWIRAAGLEVAVDRIGNIFGIWKDNVNADEAPALLGSHIDTVINAGIYDGCYGVLSGLEVVETLKSRGTSLPGPLRPRPSPMRKACATCPT
jgi:N-carbamoyl-L-amino-acid hydrolase